MPPVKKRRSRTKWVAGSLFLVLAALGAFQFLRKKETPILVQVEKVMRRDLTETVVANGRIQPVTQVIISPEVAGEIIELPVVEGQFVQKGALLVAIKPDNYRASKNSAEANYQFALGGRSQAEAEVEKAQSDFKRNEELFKAKLISESVFADFKNRDDLARLRLTNSIHTVDQARFALDKAIDDLAKTTITSPIDGTVTKLKSQLGERVLGTSFNMGTEMMTIAKLDDMEARVDIGEIDVVLIAIGQTARLEVDAFKGRKFKGTVTAIANAAKSNALGMAASTQSQEAPKFEVKIRVDDREVFRPGMSVTAEIETRCRQGVLTVPIQSVTTRLPAGAAKLPKTDDGAVDPREGKPAKGAKPIEVVFARDGDFARMIAVKTGISDNDFFEIESGLSPGEEIISGSYKAISKDLEDGKRVIIGKEPPKTGAEAK